MASGQELDRISVLSMAGVQKVTGFAQWPVGEGQQDAEGVDGTGMAAWFGTGRAGALALSTGLRGGPGRDGTEEVDEGVEEEGAAGEIGRAHV